jgi:hypothetical protein
LHGEQQHPERRLRLDALGDERGAVVADEHVGSSSEKRRREKNTS